MLAETAKHSERTPKSLDYSTFRLRSLTPHMGAEVLDLDLANPLDAQQSRDPDDAFRDWKVLVFRDQAIRRDQHKASWPCSSTTSPPTPPAHPLPGAMGSPHGDALGQPLHPTPRGLGLLPGMPTRRAGLGPERRGTRGRVGPAQPPIIDSALMSA